MRSSIEKIHQLARDYSGAPNPDAEPLELIVRSTVVTVGPMFLEVLPQDPAELDRAIEAIAMQLLELRSDGAPVLALVPDVQGVATDQRAELAAGEAST